jgi:hypothetical protein
MFFLEKLVIAYLIKKFPVFYDTLNTLLEHLIPVYSFTSYFSSISCDIVAPSRFIKCSASSFSSEILYPILVSHIDLDCFRIIKLFQLLENVWIIFNMSDLVGARGSVVGWGTMLQAGRSQVRWGHWIFSIYPIIPAAQWLCGRLNLKHKWVPGIFLGGKGQPAHRADNLTAYCEPIV